MGKLDGKVAVVTGSGRTLGRAIALSMAREAARVVLNSRTAKSTDNTSTAVDTLAEMQSGGFEATAVFADVSSMRGARDVVDAALDTFGSVDILVNNAGWSQVYAIDEMAEDEWDNIIKVNLKSQYACAHFAVPHMKKGGWGRIVNMTSRGGIHGNPAMAAYSAAKMGTVGFTYALARELEGFGITTNCIAPRADSVRTAGLRDRMAATTGKAMFKASPNLTPEHVAPICVYLATEQAAKINGQVFFAAAGTISLYDGPQPSKSLVKEGRWTLEELARMVPQAFGTALPIGPIPPTPE